MASKLELYYFPGSYYSQKVYLTLHEKQLPFTERLVFISSFGEQNEDWFLRINPAGLVPVVKDGSDVITESETIIDYLDKKSEIGGRLVPDVATPQGERVQRMRKLLDDLPIEEASFGVMLNPNLRGEITPLIRMMTKFVRRDKYEKYLKSDISNFEKKRDANPDNPAVRETMTKKIARYQWKLDNLFDEAHCGEILEGLQEAFDRIESQLVLSRKEEPDASKDVWLCGTNFSAADVTLTVLLTRISHMGVEAKYYSATKRPEIFAYRNRLFKRSSVQMLHANVSMENMGRLFRVKVAKIVCKKIAKASVVVGAVALVAYGVKKYILDK